MAVVMAAVTRTAVIELRSERTNCCHRKRLQGNMPECQNWLPRERSEQRYMGTSYHQESSAGSRARPLDLRFLRREAPRPKED
ncbi:suppressor of cytokine signaling 4 isoform 3-T4 [Dugong dugon]